MLKLLYILHLASIQSTYAHNIKFTSIYIYVVLYMRTNIRSPPYFYNPLTTLVTTFFLVTALDNKLFISIFCVELTG